MFVSFKRETLFSYKQLVFLPQDGDVVDADLEVEGLLVEVLQHGAEQLGCGVVQGQRDVREPAVGAAKLIGA